MCAIVPYVYVALFTLVYHMGENFGLGKIDKLDNSQFLSANYFFLNQFYVYTQFIHQYLTLQLVHISPFALSL